jgi:hypothetical protein
VIGLQVFHILKWGELVEAWGDLHSDIGKLPQLDCGWMGPDVMDQTV